MPDALCRDHATKPGTWGVIHVEAGSLTYTLETGEAMAVSPGTPCIIEPEVRHRVTPDGPVTFYVEFYR